MGPRNASQSLFSSLCFGNVSVLRPGIWIVLLFSCKGNTSGWIRGKVGMAGAPWNNCAVPHLESRAVPTRLLEMILFLLRNVGLKWSPFSIAEWAAVSFGRALPVWFQFLWCCVPTDPERPKWPCSTPLDCHCCVSPAAPEPACSASAGWGCTLLYFCEDFCRSLSLQDISWILHLHLERFTAALINRGSASIDWI